MHKKPVTLHLLCCLITDECSSALKMGFFQLISLPDFELGAGGELLSGAYLRVGHRAQCVKRALTFLCIHVGGYAPMPISPQTVHDSSPVET